jgi:hypothetical protein
MTVVPVFGYRSKRPWPQSYALVDREDVETLETYRIKPLKLEYGVFGNVLVKRRYFQFTDFREYHRRIALSSYIFGRFHNSLEKNTSSFQLNQHIDFPQVGFIDGNRLNLCRSNLVLLNPVW